mmetsp:Transcript_8837/g.17721  ORF Transcript_8837/g.17721 Transcript_8837/m.17721 type:complete len:225 (-) Transcript_8837:6-680(-)
MAWALPTNVQVRQPGCSAASAGTKPSQGAAESNALATCVRGGQPVLGDEGHYRGGQIVAEPVHILGPTVLANAHELEDPAHGVAHARQSCGQAAWPHGLQHRLVHVALQRRAQQQHPQEPQGVQGECLLQARPHTLHLQARQEHDQGLPPDLRVDLRRSVRVEVHPLQQRHETPHVLCLGHLDPARGGQFGSQLLHGQAGHWVCSVLESVGCRKVGLLWKHFWD